MYRLYIYFCCINYFCFNVPSIINFLPVKQVPSAFPISLNIQELVQLTLTNVVKSPSIRLVTAATNVFVKLSSNNCTPSITPWINPATIGPTTGIAATTSSTAVRVSNKPSTIPTTDSIIVFSVFKVSITTCIKLHIKSTLLGSEFIAATKFKTAAITASKAEVISLTKVPTSVIIFSNDVINADITGTLL